MFDVKKFVGVKARVKGHFCRRKKNVWNLSCFQINSSFFSPGRGGQGLYDGLYSTVDDHGPFGLAKNGFS